MDLITSLWAVLQPVLHGTLSAASVGATAIGVASVLSAYLPKASKPGAYGFARAVIDAAAFNFGNAKNAQ